MTKVNYKVNFLTALECDLWEQGSGVKDQGGLLKSWTFCLPAAGLSQSLSSISILTHTATTLESDPGVHYGIVMWLIFPCDCQNNILVLSLMSSLGLLMCHGEDKHPTKEGWGSQRRTAKKSSFSFIISTLLSIKHGCWSMWRSSHK